MLTHMGTKKIYTNRLLLRKFNVFDAEEVFKNWSNDEEVTKYLTWNPHTNLNVTKDLLDSWVLNYKIPSTYNWGIELRDTCNIIGNIGVINFNEKNLSCEIGYCLSRKYWGKGIMSEALEEVINYLFSKVNFNRIEAKHHVDNIASGKEKYITPNFGKYTFSEVLCLIKKNSILNIKFSMEFFFILMRFYMFQ